MSLTGSSRDVGGGRDGGQDFCGDYGKSLEIKRDMTSMTSYKYLMACLDILSSGDRTIKN